MQCKSSALNYIGQRLSYDTALCTVRYIGEVEGTTGLWLGVEWDDQARGKHDGSHKGVRYFECTPVISFSTSAKYSLETGLSKSPTAASFIRPTRRPGNPQSFLSALHEKYASDHGRYAGGPDAQIVIFGGGKVAQEMGFDKIAKKQSRLGELKVVILDGMSIDRARGEGDDKIRDVCPSVTQLDVSRNLWESLIQVFNVCAELKNLKKLSLRYGFLCRGLYAC